MSNNFAPVSLQFQGKQFFSSVILNLITVNCSYKTC